MTKNIICKNCRKTKKKHFKKTRFGRIIYYCNKYGECVNEFEPQESKSSDTQQGLVDKDRAKSISETKERSVLRNLPGDTNSLTASKDNQKLAIFAKIPKTDWKKKVFGILHNARNKKRINIDDDLLKLLSGIIGKSLDEYFTKLYYVGRK